MATIGSQRRGLIGDVYHYGKKTYQGTVGALFSSKKAAYNAGVARGKASAGNGRWVRGGNMGAIRVARKWIPRNPKLEPRELKCLEIPSGSLTTTVYPTIDMKSSGGTYDQMIYCCGISEGSGLSERVGRRVSAKLFELSGAVYSPVTVTKNDSLRIMLIVDRSFEGATGLSMSLVLRDSTANPVTSLRNVDYKKKYKILYDKKITVKQISGTSGTGAAIRIEFVRQFYSGLHIKYKGSTGGATDCVENAIYLVIFGSERVFGDSNNDKCKFIFQARLRYHDLT